MEFPWTQLVCVTCTDTANQPAKASWVLTNNTVILCSFLQFLHFLGFCHGTL